MKMPQFIWRIIRYRIWQYLADVGTDIVFVTTRLAFGLIIQGFFNALQQQSRLSPALWDWIGLLLLAAFLRGVIAYGNARITVGINFLQRTLLHRNLLERILQRPGARAVPASPGEAMNRFRDDVQNGISLTNTTTDVIANSYFMIAATYILVRISLPITLTVFLPLILVIAIAQSMKKRLTVYRQASREATSELTSAIGEIFGAVQAIQVAGAEPEVVTHFRGLNDKRRLLILRDTVLSNTLTATFANTVGIGRGVILIMVALSIRSHGLGVGDLAIFLYYLSSVSGFVQSVGNLLAQYIQTDVSFGRLVELLQGAPAASLVIYNPLYVHGAEPPELPRQRKTPEQPLKQLEARNLSYHYPDTGRGISNINLTLKRGSITVITGRIGSGKTTLLQALLGLLPKDEGEIIWNGKPVSDPASFFVPPQSAYTAQVPHLFSDPLKENILLGLREEDVDIQRAVHTAVLDHDVALLENGLDTVIGPRGVKLSGGQAQRTAAARMLVRQSDLLVFDDLSSALDVETEQTMWERLFAQGAFTCLVVSHRKAVLQRADHILVLKHGYLEAEGTLPELMATCEEMQQLWHGAWENREEDIVEI
jgi:ATP-binding cassette subfamily B protein